MKNPTLPPPAVAPPDLPAAVAQALHDSVCQTLGGSVLMVGVLAARLQAGRAVTVDDLEELSKALHQALDEARAVMHQLTALPRSPRGVRSPETSASSQPADCV